MNTKTIYHIRCYIGMFMFFLLASGITAFPLEWELNLLSELVSNNLSPNNHLSQWLQFVTSGLKETYARFPFIAYGTDWLAFAHIVIAVAFIGPLKDPIKNIWVIEFGIIACLLVFPLAFIAGTIRAIPFYWILIDCSFGAFGLIPLLVAHRKTRLLEINITNRTI